jgi:hypothetical protein
MTAPANRRRDHAYLRSPSAQPRALGWGQMCRPAAPPQATRE